LAADARAMASKLGIIPPMDPATRISAFDAFTNSAARMGWGTPNLAESTEYSLVRTSYDYWLLITLYRNHWISRRIVDTPAHDMVRSWPTIRTEAEPGDQKKIDSLIRRTNTRSQVLTALRWARLFGGAGALMIIDGHENKLETPLRVDDVETGAYRGLIPFDRWTGISPMLSVCGDITRPNDFGLPEFYQVTAQSSAKTFKVHASRILRFTGPTVPTPEREAQSWWGISALEPAFEELRKRDNLSWNLLSLSFRASIIGMVMPDLAQALSGAGMTTAALEQFYSRMEGINHLLSNQSLVMLPKDGTLSSVNFSGEGWANIYQQFQLDIAGASEIPVTRLFGRTLTGLGQSNEADERIYEERIAMEQDHGLRPQLEKLYPVMCMSELGEVPRDMDLKFPSVRVLAEEEKSRLASDTVACVVSLANAGLMPKPTAIKEIRQQSTVTGFGTNYTDDDIDKAEELEEAMGLGGMAGLAGGEPGAQQQPGMQGAPQGAPQGAIPPPATPHVGERSRDDRGGDARRNGEFLDLLARAGVPPPERQSAGELLDFLAQEGARARAADAETPIICKAADSRVVNRYRFAGMPISVEYPAGVRRQIKNKHGKVVYERLMAYDYGFIDHTMGRDGDEIDVVIGPDESAEMAYVVDMVDLGPDERMRQNEDKVMLGFPDFQFAKEAFLSMYPMAFFGGMLALPVQKVIDTIRNHKAVSNNERGLGFDMEHGRRFTDAAVRLDRTTDEISAKGPRKGPGRLGEWARSLRKMRQGPEFAESKHPRGQPQNQGQFVGKGGRGKLHPESGSETAAKAWATIHGGRKPVASTVPPQAPPQRQAPVPEIEISPRALRAMENAKVCDRAKQLIGTEEEKIVAKALGMTHLGDTNPFDIVNTDSRVAIEMKAMPDSKHGKITINKHAMALKRDQMRRFGLQVYTVVADKRTEGKTTYYVKSDLGSFHVTNMYEVTLEQLRDIVAAKKNMP
jgi:phage-related protein (TIGR01555 family)